MSEKSDRRGATAVLAAAPELRCSARDCVLERVGHGPFCAAHDALLGPALRRRLARAVAGGETSEICAALDAAKYQVMMRAYRRAARAFVAFLREGRS